MLSANIEGVLVPKTYKVLGLIPCTRSAQCMVIWLSPATGWLPAVSPPLSSSLPHTPKPTPTGLLPQLAEEITASYF